MNNVAVPVVVDPSTGPPGGCEQLRRRDFKISGATMNRLRNTRTITAPPPTSAPIFTRELCQQLSHVAGLVDRCDVAPPMESYRLARLHQLEADARRELRALRDRLAMMALD